MGTEPWMRAVDPHLVLCETTVLRREPRSRRIQSEYFKALRNPQIQDRKKMQTPLIIVFLRWVSFCYQYSH